MSYNGGLNFGLLADYDSMKDVELLANGLNQSLTELLEAAALAEDRMKSDLATGADLPG
jgi:hypothetical protein